MKCSDISGIHEYLIDTRDGWCRGTISNAGHWALSEELGDSRLYDYLLQTLLVAIQWWNAMAVLGTCHFLRYDLTGFVLTFLLGSSSVLTGWQIDEKRTGDNVAPPA